jgi:two-component system, sensor histidine kinase PdtaS
MIIKLSLRKALFIGIFFVVIYLFIALSLQNQPLNALFIYSMGTFLYIVVALCLYLAANASRIYGRRTQVAWAMLTLAVLTSVIGSILWGVLVFYHKDPSNLVADISYLIFIPLFLIGIIIFPSYHTTQRQRLKRYFDMLIIMVSITLCLWIFLITPAFQNYQGDFTSLTLRLAYIFGGFLIVFALIDLLSKQINKDMYAPALILLGGILVLIVTQCVFVYQTIHGTYLPVNIASIGWIMGYMLLGLAGIAQFTQKKIDVDNVFINYLSGNKNYSVTPYLALAGVTIGYISLIWAYNTFNPNLTFLEFGVGILIFLVVSRQFISISDNQLLYKKAQKEISLREEISKSLKESESAYRTIFENTGTATVIIDEEDIISLANTEFEKLSGYSKEDLEHNMHLTDFILQDYIGRRKEYKLPGNGKKSDPKKYEFLLKDRAGIIKNIFVVEVIIPGTRDSLISLLDVTESKNAEAEIKRSLKEKETLLKEIHHRVKNNLTVISSLLNLQSRYIKDKDDLMMFKESQSRAKSMALIHQKLYATTDLKRIDFRDYISTLAHEMFNTYVSDSSKIKLDLNVDDVMLDIDTAIPLGLILNELLTNSLKYAFPASDVDSNNKIGHIRVGLVKNNNIYTLSVEDDGIGFPEDIDLENTNSLGLRLINTLTEQIKGKMYIKGGNGTSFKIEFKDKKY